ncbi:MAG: hypothetical protein ABFC63_10950 [Thermoguttaceae bacterium]
MTSGTKSFCSKVGDTLTFKKSTAKRATAQYAVPRSPAIATKKTESKSWFGSWFKTSEPAKPRNVGEWMQTSKRMDP